MKRMLKVLAIGIFSTLTVWSAEQPAPGGMPGGGPGAPGAGPGGPGGGRGNFQGRGGFGMPLDEQQRGLYQAAIQKEDEKLRGLDEKLRAAQKVLVEATLASPYDEKAVREKAEAVAKIQVEITMLRAGALATVSPTLKPEQKQQLVESRFAIMMLSGGGMGGGPGGPGGFGGPGGPGGFRAGGAGGPPDATGAGFSGGRNRQPRER